MNNHLQVGNFYTVRYKSHSANYRWYEHEFTAKYLGSNTRYQTNETSWSLRPLADTCSVRTEDIISITSATTPRPSLPKRVPRGLSGKSSLEE